MSGAGGGSRLTPTEKEIARKLPLLDEEQQKRYDKFLILGIDANGTDHRPVPAGHCERALETNF